MRFRKLCPGYVWCDYHGGIHVRERDAYGESSKECRPANWRKVYVETNDSREKF